MARHSIDHRPDATTLSARLPDAEEERPVSTTRVGQTTQDSPQSSSSSHSETASPHSSCFRGLRPTTIADIQKLPGAPASSHRYQELRQIASGSTSVVSEAFDWRIRRRVALKRLHAELTESAIAGRFRRERLIASWLDHPNILPVYDFLDSDSGTPGLVMKYIQGRTLAEEVRSSKDGLSSVYRLLLILSQVGDAIQFAHDAGVIHGDLKPQNIMVGASGEAYVMDWGIARFRPDVELQLSDLLIEAEIPLEAKKSSAGTHGTPAYMAPEQVHRQAGEIDERTDVFGLGAILYQILTGRSLYEGVQIAAVLEKAARAEITAPRKRQPGRPIRPALDALCMRALARNPEDRFQTAGHFVEALRTAMMSGSWFELRDYRAGDVIVAQGQPSAEAFLIEHGECEVSQLSPSGEHVFLRVLGPGDAFGETGVFTDSPRTASVVARQGVQVQCIDRQSLKWAMDEGGPLGVLVRTLAKRFIEREQELYSLVPPSEHPSREQT